MQIDQIINNKFSSARQIIDNKTDTIFFPSKSVGIAENRYIPDKKDIFNEMRGSVICRNLSIEDNRCKYVFAILNITTYGSEICDVNNDDAKNNILNVILPPFEERIKLELSLAYIKNVLAR